MIKVIDTSNKENYKPSYYLMLYGFMDMWRDKIDYLTIEDAEAAAMSLMQVPHSERYNYYEMVAVMETKMIRRVVDE